ncbi:uncharacterized protein LOC135377802 isoform X2 [Ornithodoros turicata]|uniref:uncharacterized protein LOC135377802 isoform X2 n=1 Tax=Ornithodoros turicata TaxID=34597 RepID=UPI003139721A
MVCKEEIYTWFRQLNGSVRIDTMCGLLNLCLPLELRFLGTCLEDLASKDYTFFRDAEQRANNLSEVSKCTDLKDSVARSKLITSLALLHLINSSCSHAIYLALEEEMKSGRPVNYDEQTLQELLLLFTMAMRHPSFTFYERIELVKYCETLERALEPQDITPGSPGGYIMPIMPCTPYPVPLLPPYQVASEGAPCIHAHSNATATQKSGISTIDVMTETRPKKSVWLRIHWLDGRLDEVTRTFEEIQALYAKLSQLSAADPLSRGKNIPRLPACVEKNGESEGMHLELAEFFSSVASLPASYLGSNGVAPFFQTTLNNKSFMEGKEQFVLPPGSSTSPDVSVPPPEDPRLCFALYGNAQVHPMPSHLPSCLSNGSLLQSTTDSVTQPSLDRCIQATSPLSSAPESPIESPATSGSNSRATSPWTAPRRPPRSWVPHQQDGTATGVEELLRRLHLKKYQDAFKNCTIEDVLSMNEDDLKHRGLLSHSIRRLLKEIAVLKNLPHTNGVVGSHRNNHSGTLAQVPTDSSASCSSGCSSPSPPPALKDSQIQSSTSSSSEECTQSNINVRKWPSCNDTLSSNPTGLPGSPSEPLLRLPPPSVLQYRFGPPAVIADHQHPHRYMVLTDRSPSYASRAPCGVVRGVGHTPVLPSKVVAAGELTPVTTTVSGTTSFPPHMCGAVGYVPHGMFPQHHPFNHFVTPGAGSPMTPHPPNGFLPGFPYPTSPGFTPAAYVQISSLMSASPVAPAASSPLPVPGGASGTVGTTAPASCYNCGMTGHKGPDCKEPSVEERMRLYKYRVNYAGNSVTSPDPPQP